MDKNDETLSRRDRRLRCYAFPMNQHEGNDPGQRDRDRAKTARAWLQTRFLVLVIAVLVGVIVATLGKRFGFY